MERIRQHLSYANVAATLALVFAMSGGAIAATGGFTAASSSIKACVGANGVLKVLSGKKCKSGQKAVFWNQQGPAGSRGATGAQGATGATGPTGTAGLNGAPGPSATTALTANNALALGGIPASDFTRSDCASTTGQIKGFALVSKDLPNRFAPVSPSYNCSGQPVEALEGEVGTGIYIVRFSGNPAEIAMATAVDDEPLQAPGVASVKQLAPGEFEVFTASPSEQLGPQAFELLLP
jgi:hypothetical protein